jgi:signal transduction histidine kinase
MSERTEFSEVRRHRLVLLDFIEALGNRYTYSVRHNPEVLFGFLWGVPVPLFALWIHAHATGSSCDPAYCLTILRDNPLYIVFILHPVIFAVVFGALGTMREHRESHIRKLLAEAEQHCHELGKTNARLIELDRYKSEFLANVTHELKSPLVTALGYTDRMLGNHLGEITDRQRKGLEVSKRNLQRLRQLIDEILDFSRLDAGVARFDMGPHDLLGSVHSAVEGLALKAKDRNVTLTMKMPHRPATVIGDAAKLLQVVINLVDNAIKFSRESGAVEISVENDGTYVRLTVADNGVGISPQILPHLFQRFVQEDGTLSRNYDGVGLGLVIVKKIIDAHGGRVWIESEQGRGTKVHIELRAAGASISSVLACSSLPSVARKEEAHA